MVDVSQPKADFNKLAFFKFVTKYKPTHLYSCMIHIFLIVLVSLQASLYACAGGREHPVSLENQSRAVIGSLMQEHLREVKDQIALLRTMDYARVHGALETFGLTLDSPLLMKDPNIFKTYIEQKLLYQKLMNSHDLSLYAMGMLSPEETLRSALQLQLNTIWHRQTRILEGANLINTDPMKLETLGPWALWTVQSSQSNHEFIMEILATLLSVVDLTKIDNRTRGLLVLNFGLRHFIDQSSLAAQDEAKGHPDDLFRINLFGILRTRALYETAKTTYVGGLWKRTYVRAGTAMAESCYDTLTAESYKCCDTIDWNKYVRGMMPTAAGVGIDRAVLAMMESGLSFHKEHFRSESHEILLARLHRNYQEASRIEAARSRINRLVWHDALRETRPEPVAFMPAEVGAMPTAIHPAFVAVLDEAAVDSPEMEMALYAEALAEPSEGAVETSSDAAGGAGVAGPTLSVASAMPVELVEAHPLPRILARLNTRQQKALDKILDPHTRAFSYDDFKSLWNHLARGENIRLNASSHGHVYWDGERFAPIYRPHPKPVFGVHGMQSLRSILYALEAKLASEV